MVTVEVTFPPAFAGEISQYLNSKRGRIQGMDSAGEQQVIRAGIPAAEIQTFSSDLRSMTQGQADYLVEPAGFEQVPPQVQHAVVDKYQKERGMVAEEE
jgi:elongation factor G